MAKAYSNAAAFRQALEARLKTVAEQRGVQIQGLRLKVAIERLLARLFNAANPPWLLKGGYSMELRFRPKARTTRDVDLSIGDFVAPEKLKQKLEEVHEALQSVVQPEEPIADRIPVPDVRGQCLLFCHRCGQPSDGHPVTRALFNAGHLVVNREGKYLLSVPAFSTRRGLAQREDMVKKLAKLVNARYGVQVGYFSVLNSSDPDAIPTYNSDFLDDRQIYNFWSESL